MIYKRREVEGALVVKKMKRGERRSRRKGVLSKVKNKRS